MSNPSPYAPVVLPFDARDQIERALLGRTNISGAAAVMNVLLQWPCIAPNAAAPRDSRGFIPHPDAGIREHIAAELDALAIEARGSAETHASWGDRPDLVRRYHLIAEEYARLSADLRSPVPSSEDTPAPRVWPVGSPEPDEKGLRVRAANGVEFVHKGGFPPWHAEPPVGDGHYFTWHALNAARHHGHELIEVPAGGKA